MIAAAVSSIVVLAADGASDSGGADPGESASAWDAGGFLFWTVVVLVGAAILVLGLLVRSRSARSARAAPAAAAPSGAAQARRVEDVHPEAGWDLAVLTFDHLQGAERAYATVSRDAGVGPWTHDLAFVEVHRHGRVRIRGSFAGHYLDIDDLAEAGRGDTAMLDTIRADVPEGCSGLLAFAPPEQVEALVDAFGARRAQLNRRRVSADEASALASSVDHAPAATASDNGRSETP
jgi:hypothetical protein